MAVSTTASFPQYAGELYMFGNTNTPFLAALGPEAVIVDNFDFAVSSVFTAISGTQTSITETASITAPSTYVSYTRDQAVNSCQIIQKYVRTSHKMMSSYNKLIGNSSDYGSIYGPNAITDVHDHNIMATLRNIYKDINYTCWNGVYQRAANAGVAGLSRGLNAAITTHETTISGAMSALTTADVDNHLAGVADAGNDMSNVVIWVGSAAKVKISNLYSLSLQTQPRDRNIGGVNVQTLITDFGEFPIVYDADVPVGKVFFIDMNVVKNVWCPVPGKGNLFLEDKSDVAAGFTSMIYGQWGLDHGPEQAHSVIKTSDAA